MNDLSQIENELRKLRRRGLRPFFSSVLGGRRWIVGCLPRRTPSGVLGGVSQERRTKAGASVSPQRLFSFCSRQSRWSARKSGKEKIAQTSREPEAAPLLNRPQKSTSTDKFVPAGATRLAFTTRATRIAVCQQLRPAGATHALSDS